jgi:hypothetical protein
MHLLCLLQSNAEGTWQAISRTAKQRPVVGAIFIPSCRRLMGWQQLIQQATTVICDGVCILGPHHADHPVQVSSLRALLYMHVQVSGSAKCI